MGDGLPALPGQQQLLGAGIFVTDGFPQFAGVDELAYHPTDTGFLQAQHLDQPGRGHRAGSLDLQQSMDRRCRIVGAGQGGPHEAQLADHGPRGGANRFDQGWIAAHLTASS